MLTDKQEKYIQERVRGETQRQAYYIAYPRSKNWKPETVDNKAYVLEKKGEVKARLQELKKKASKKLEKKIYNESEKAVDERVAMLETIRLQIKKSIGEEPTKTLVKEIINGEPVTTVNKICLETDLKAFKSLVELYAKLMGWMIDKVEHSGVINQNNITDMSEEELEAEIKKQQAILNKVR